jgi:hypothetical protein
VIFAKLSAPNAMPSASIISLMSRIALGAATILHKISNIPRKSSAPRKPHGTMPRTHRKPMRQFSSGFKFGASPGQTIFWTMATERRPSQ